MTESTLTSLQTQIFDQTGIRTDVYYREGRGALFVRENDPLTPQNVILAVPDVEYGFGGLRTAMGL